MRLLLNHIPKLSWILSGKSPAKFLILLCKLWYFALSRKLTGVKKDFVITGRYNQSQLKFYLRYVMDIAVLVEVFIYKEYEWFPVENPKVIIDLGAHFGDTTLYYAAKFPNAKIISVEPSPENYQRLVKNVKNMPNIVPVQAAIGDQDGFVELSLGDSTFGHSVISRKDEVSKVTVVQKSIQTLFFENDIEKADLIKFDIEGAEFKLFESLDSSEFAYSYIGELHLDLEPEYSLEKFLLLFNTFQNEIEKIKGGDRYLVKFTLSAS